MKTYKLLNVPASTKKVCTAVVCDICGNVGAWGGWDMYDYETIEVARETPKSRPAGEPYRRSSFDICPTCWDDVLVPFLKEKGAEPTVEEGED